jgi:ribosome-associated translation inhibitor RaiA
VKIEIEGIASVRGLRSRVQNRLRKALRSLPLEPVTALVNFTDVNGPKGGVDKRCALTVSLPRRRNVHVEELATNQELAFNTAVDALERKLKRQAELQQDRRRRPKKYYVAKQLMMPESPTLAPEGPPSPRRRRRAPSA